MKFRCLPKNMREDLSRSNGNSRLLKVSSSFIALFVCFSFFLLLNLPASSKAEYKSQISSTRCSMPCCEEKVDTKCCCQPLPKKSHENVPASNSSNSGYQGHDLVFEVENFDSHSCFVYKSNMAGWTSGLTKPMPPPVKLYIFNEAFLC